MNKDALTKFLYPNIILFILITVVGYGGVICVFLFDLVSHWISYIAYVLSAYALTVTVARSINWIKWINEKLHSNKYTNKLITDRSLRSHINLFSGTFFNMIFGIFRVIVGIIYLSVWFGATGVYYLVLGIMKLILTKNVLKKVSLSLELKQYRNTGILMFLLNVTMVGMIVLMIKNGESAVYPGFVIYAQAAYTFYILPMAFINIFKYRKEHTPIFMASKAINLVVAIMSMFILQVAMINQFGGDETFAMIINTISGSVTSIVTIGIAVFMIINSKKNFNNNLSLEEDN